MEKGRIQILEDEAIIAMEIESMLLNSGYEVTSIVDTGEKAIAKAEEDKPDLILSDIRINGKIDGIETAEIIRNKLGIPVIFATAYLDEERIERAKITIPFGYILKPIEERDLKVTIEMALYVSKGDRKRTRAEKRFRTIFEEAPLGVALIDSLTGHIYEVNPKFAEIAGRTREEMATTDWMKITHPDDVQEDLDNMTLLNSGKISGFNMNKRYIRPDGSFVWINMTIAPVTVEDISHPRHLCMIEDITERKQMEETVKDSLEKHRTLFETMSQGVVYQDADGNITDANPAAERILGLSLDQMQGRTSLDPRWKSIHEDCSDFPGETHPGMVALKTGKKVSNVIMGVYHPQKEDHRWININAVPKFREGESTPYEVFATFEDITDIQTGKK